MSCFLICEHVRFPGHCYCYTTAAILKLATKNLSDQSRPSVRHPSVNRVTNNQSEVAINSIRPSFRQSLGKLQLSTDVRSLVVNRSAGRRTDERMTDERDGLLNETAFSTVGHSRAGQQNDVIVQKYDATPFANHRLYFALWRVGSLCGSHLAEVRFCGKVWCNMGRWRRVKDDSTRGVCGVNGREVVVPDDHHEVSEECEEIWAALNIEVLRDDEGEVNAEIQGPGKREIPEKTRRPAASSGTNPTCENPGANPPGIDPGSSRWEASSLTTTPLRPLTTKLLYCYVLAVSHPARASGSEGQKLYDSGCRNFGDRRRAVWKVTSGREICDCEFHALKCETGRLDHWTRCTPLGTPRPRLRSEGAIGATLTLTPSAASLLRARRAVFPSLRCTVQIRYRRNGVAFPSMWPYPSSNWLRETPGTNFVSHSLLHTAKFPLLPGLQADEWVSRL
ncbi:hypothetical protein PR048_020577 [Dryococelus australis]|uniref:Uncharacterized protein n=1 Tax=Dryococelus australis TaxID=614101 RepID=A0ABQ9H6Q1_9NEOP|nr:hypothetical protein PR048_020577 [Dryococelus australis]